MTSTLRPLAHRTSSRVDRSGHRPPLVDQLGPLIVAVWIVVYFQPFALRVPLPGFVSSVLFPALCAGVLLLTPIERLRRIPLMWPLVLVVVLLGASLLWSEIPDASMFRIRADLPAAVLVALVAGTMPPKQVVRTFAVVSTAIAVWSLLISLAVADSRQAQFEEAFLGAQDGFRGTFGHKNQLGIFLAIGLCAVLVQPRARWQRIAILVHIVTMFGTRSASVGGGLLAVAFVWLWVSAIERQEQPRARAFLLATSIVSAVAGVLLVLGLMPVLLDLYDKDVTFSGRTFIWTESIATIGDQPWFGYGFSGVWADETSPVTADLQARIGFPAPHAHNGAIDLALQIGLVGLVAYLLLLIRAFRSSARALVRPASSGVGQWGLLVLSTILLVSIAENIFLGPYLAMVGIVATVAHRALLDADPTEAQRPEMRRWVEHADRR